MLPLLCSLLPDFTTAIQSGNETTQNSKCIIYVSTLAEKGPAMARPAGPVPAPMCYYVSANQEIFTEGEW